MQVPASLPAREHEKPMSWARAMLIATGFFFVTAILLGQLPSYVYTVVTLSTLARMEQGFLALGLLALGMGMMCFEISFLYDPRPLIPWQLFALVGAGLGAVGTFIVYMVSVGVNATSIFGFNGWSHFLPDAVRTGNTVSFWPVPNQSYLFHPAWFQPQSIDLASVGMIAILTGVGMVTIAVLCPFVLSGRLMGPTRDLIVRLSLGLAVVISGIWLTAYTFAADAVLPLTGAHGPFGNILLFIALALAFIGLLTWLLPIMVANRQQFMPAVYLHGVVGLIGTVAVPMLILWAIIYPVVNAIHSVDGDQFWVQCSQKTVVPGSCTFTQFTGYIICAIVFTNLFALLMAGIYFWSTRRNTVVLGGTIGIIYLGLAVTVLHTQVTADAGFAELPLSLVVATGIVVMAFIYTWATQREFASTVPAQLGCLGQWLVFGTLIMVFLFGFAFFSFPKLFELESGLAFFFNPGPHLLHDAFWVALLMAALIVLQFILLIRRQDAPMGNLRRLVFTACIIATTLLIASGIMGVTHDVLSEGVDAMDGGSAVAVGGLGFALGAVLIALYGAVRARGLASGWSIAIVVSALVGIAFAYISYMLPGAYPELVIFGFILIMAGAAVYAVAGPDAPLYDEVLPEQGNGFVVTER